VYRIRWRRDFIIPLTFVIMVGVLTLVLLQLDRLYYQNAKYDIIRSNPEKFIPFNRTLLSRLTKQALDAPPDSPQRRAYLAQLEKAGGDLLEPSTPFFSFQVQDEDDPERALVSIENPEKLKTNNTRSNSLFLRDFSRSTDVLIEGMDPTQSKAVGRYILRFTTPLNSPDIEDLTVAWRWRCLFISVGFFVAYGLILKFILLPVRRVIACLERTDRLAPEILRRPGTLLERAYNNLARDASLTQLAARLRDRIADDPSLEPQKLLDLVPGDIKTYFGFKDLSFWTLRADEGGSLWTIEKVHGHAYNPGSVSEDSLAEYLKKEVARTPPENLDERWSDHVGDYRREDGTTEVSFFSAVERRKGPDTLTIMVIPAQDRRSSPPSAWRHETYRLAGEQVRVALDSLTSQRRLILQEKSKANISLARNLGHDLTNIIATGKLDIMTIRRFLNLPPDRWVSQPQKEDIFRTSLSAVLNNSRFLQEIVNIYRSFSYLSRPKFETVDPRTLVSDVVELFRLSLSKAIEVEVTLPEQCPSCLMEPRLVKLALFNLLTNAADAIKRTFTTNSMEQGRIEVRLEVGDDGENGEEVRISVADSGTGILDEDGRPLPQAEMERLFHMGYSTKDKQEGEGLGLNWVHSIITDFHGGRVSPRNRPEGGAEFSICLRVKGPAETGKPQAGPEGDEGATAAESSGPAADSGSARESPPAPAQPPTAENPA